MTHHNIYYVKKDGGRDIIRSGELFPSDLIDNDYSYSECPVWSHKSNRTFVCEFPMDCSFFVDFETGEIDLDYDYPEDIEDFIHVEEDEDIDGRINPTLQITLPKYFFWTDSSDIWIEYLDHPLTAYKNNFVTLGGWWNLSNYPRGNSFALQVVDRNRPVVINKGDPIFRIRFFSKNFDDGFNLIKLDDNNIDYQKAAANLSEDIRDDSNLLKNLLFKKSCPFSFLHKK